MTQFYILKLEQLKYKLKYTFDPFTKLIYITGILIYWQEITLVM